MKLRALLALAGTLVALQAGAQPIYRCGNSYSDQPCGADARVIDAPVSVVPSQVPGNPWAGYAPLYVVPVPSHGYKHRSPYERVLRDQFERHSAPPYRSVFDAPRHRH